MVSRRSHSPGEGKVTRDGVTRVPAASFGVMFIIAIAPNTHSGPSSLRHYLYFHNKDVWRCLSRSLIYGALAARLFLLPRTIARYWHAVLRVIASTISPYRPLLPVSGSHYTLRIQQSRGSNRHYHSVVFLWDASISTGYWLITKFHTVCYGWTLNIISRYTPGMDSHRGGIGVKKSAFDTGGVALSGHFHWDDNERGRRIPSGMRCYADRLPPCRNRC